MGEIINKEVGAEGNFNVSMNGGKVRIQVGYDGKQLDAGMFIELDGAAFLDKLADAIPGDLDNMVITAIKAAMLVAK